LVIPQLLDNGIVDEGEEDKPSILVMEDLVASGIEIRSYKDAISDEDAVAVYNALGDLHDTLWRIRNKLGISLVQVTDCDGVQEFDKMLIRSFEQFGNYYTTGRLVGLVSPLCRIIH